MDPIVSRGLIYAATYISAVYFRREESLITILHAILLLILAYNSPSNIVKTALVAGPLMTFAEYICIKNHGMWYYNNTAGTIPYWLIFTWTLVAFFIIDVYRFMVKYA